jgi:transposase InsO family protein
MKLLDAQLAAGVRVNAAEFAREHGVSARTVYRHRARVRAEGQWRERSRRPHSSPRTTPPDLDAWICKLRVELAPDNGADFIRDALGQVQARTSPVWSVPSRSTINRVLGRHNLLQRNPAKRPRSSWRRFSYARPRDCYQIDATEVKLADGSAVVVFDVLDDCTRTLVACHACDAETAQGAIAAIGKAFAQYGAPAIVLSDNGTAFTSRLTKPGSISTFVQTLLERRVRPVNSSPYHPQTCGKVERHHQTLKKWLRTQPTPQTIGSAPGSVDSRVRCSGRGLRAC